MKSLKILFFISAFFLFACSSKTDRPAETVPVQQPKPKPQTNTPHDSKGTSIHIDNDGVNVGHNDGKGKSDIKIGRDTLNVDINTKKK